MKKYKVLIEYIDLFGNLSQLNKIATEEELESLKQSTTFTILSFEEMI